MRCKNCKIEIFFDSEDREWLSVEEDDIGKYQTPICYIKELLTSTKTPLLEWHLPDLFQEYLKELNEM